MGWKSHADRYGSAIVTLHWLSALILFPLLGTGIAAGNAESDADKIALLRIHIPLALTLLSLTLVRIIARLCNRAPEHADTPAYQRVAAKAVHFALYLMLAIMFASGIALLIQSGAGKVVFGAPGMALPDFRNFGPLGPHSFIPKLLIAAVAAHIAAALYHVLIRRDGVFRRMWFGKRA